MWSRQFLVCWFYSVTSASKCEASSAAELGSYRNCSKLKYYMVVGNQCGSTQPQGTSSADLCVGERRRLTRWCRRLLHRVTVWRNGDDKRRWEWVVVTDEHSDRTVTELATSRRLHEKNKIPNNIDFSQYDDLNPLTPTSAISGTAIKHPVPDRVKPSFVIFGIRALWRSVKDSNKWAFS